MADDPGPVEVFEYGLLVRRQRCDGEVHERLVVTRDGRRVIAQGDCWPEGTIRSGEAPPLLIPLRRRRWLDVLHVAAAVFTVVSVALFAWSAVAGDDVTVVRAVAVAATVVFREALIVELRREQRRRRSS